MGTAATRFVAARWTATALGLCLFGAAQAADAGKRIVFVACPVLRNTTLPCWMSVFHGELYYLGPQGDLTEDFYPPQLGHRVLVEATVSEEPRICGGIVLKDVVASVLPVLDQSCNTILPAEGYPDPPNERGPGPSGERGVAPAVRLAPPATPPPKPPFSARSFTSTFNADTTRMWRPAQVGVRQAATYANQVNARAIEVVGYRAAIKLADGTMYVEDPAIAQERAEVMTAAIRAVGIPGATRVKTRWVRTPVGGKGDRTDAEARKVVITVTPGAPAASD